MDEDLELALTTDRRFFRAMLLGFAIGVPSLLGVLTAIFAATTSHGWLNVAAYSALAAVFCGPFLGGLFTTAYASSIAERAAGHAEPAAEPLEQAA